MPFCTRGGYVSSRASQFLSNVSKSRSMHLKLNILVHVQKKYNLACNLSFSNDNTKRYSKQSIDLFGLYVLFSQYKSCDNTLRNCIFQISFYSRVYVLVQNL